MTVTAQQKVAFSGTLLTLCVLPEKLNVQVSLTQGGNPGPHPVFSWPLFQPQPPRRFLGTQFENPEGY